MSLLLPINNLVSVKYIWATLSYNEKLVEVSGKISDTKDKYHRNSVRREH